MDGAGSLTRSFFRSLRPQADLKAAAVGAVVLLREWVQDKRQERLHEKRAAAKEKIRTKAKPVIERTPPPRVIALVERYLPRRVGISMTVLLLIGSCGFGIVKGGHLQDFITAVSDARNAMANSAGFRITSVVINGRKQLSQDEILAIGGVSGRSSLLFLDADGGALLEPYVSRRFLSLPLVVGKGADTQARDFLALLARYPQVNSVTKAAILVGERRWNLRLKDGLDIRLPEQDVGNALAALSKLDKEDKLFSRDIVAVDMRLPDRLVVQLSDDAAKAREDQFKDKKSKKKAGDSA